MNISLAIIRIWAVLVVVLGHYFVIGKVGIFQNEFIFDGHKGVLLFFCLSGYLFSKNYKIISSVRNFLKKRYIRLSVSGIPMFVAAYFVFLIQLKLEGFGAFTLEKLLLLFFSGLTYTVAIFNKLIGPSNTGVMINWSLTYEWIFYLSYAICNKYFKKQYLLLLILCLIDIDFLMFLLGVLIGNKRRLISIKIPKFISYVMIIIGTFTFVPLIFTYFLYFVAMYSLSQENELSNSLFFKSLSNSTYTIYLSHMIFFYALSYFLNNELNYFFIFLSLVITFFISYIWTKYIESKFIYKLQKKFL
jgi:peptidoglycan/LPS O-acetylase OafA/YrhL